MKSWYILLMFMLITAMPLNAQKRSQYSVKNGDTYAKIASAYGIEETTLRQANKGCPNELFPGLILEIPTQLKQASEKVQKYTENGVYDRLILRDSSFIDCKILSANKTLLQFKQNEVDGTLQLSIKEIAEIRYADGSIKRYGKLSQKGGRR